MDKYLKIGLLGCGGIGTTIAEALEKKSFFFVELLCLYDRDLGKAIQLKKKLKKTPAVANSFEDFLDSPFDLLLECASQEAIRDYAEKALRSDKDLLILSVGALMEDALRERLMTTAAEQSRRIYLPSGAIGGLDILRAASEGQLYSVRMTTRKNPSAFEGSTYFIEHHLSPKDLCEKVTLYEGPAKEAVRLFPANVNVAATLSMAGLGAENTKVTIIADPELKVNVHEIEIKGDFGEAKLTVENVPHPDNPRTSYLAALSALETIRRAFGM